MPAYLAGMDASGRSSAELLQNSFSPSHPRIQGISLALAISRDILAGNGAARVHGGGFAGTIQALMPEELFVRYRREMETVFGKGCCIRLGIVGP
jgi:galactokinase